MGAERNRGPGDLADIFARQFYFGCEGDDPMNALAFASKGSPSGMRLRALYGSTWAIGMSQRWTRQRKKAHELVDQGLLAEEDFSAMVWRDPVRFWTSTNPDFFRGTVVEHAAASAREG